MKDPKPGDTVSWKSHGGTAHGKVVKKIASPTKIKDHKVAASKDNPEFIVETDEGKKAAHKAGLYRPTERGGTLNRARFHRAKMSALRQRGNRDRRSADEEMADIGYWGDRPSTRPYAS